MTDASDEPPEPSRATWELGSVIECFFSSEVDRDLLTKCRKAFVSRFGVNWTDSAISHETRVGDIAALADELDASGNVMNAALRCLVYVALGNFAEFEDNEAWLCRVRSNCALLEASGAIEAALVLALVQLDGTSATSADGPGAFDSFYLPAAFVYIVTTISIEGQELSLAGASDYLGGDRLVRYVPRLCRLLVSLAERNKDDARIPKVLLLFRNFLHLALPPAALRSATREKRYERAGLSGTRASILDKGGKAGTINCQRVSPADYLRFASNVQERHPEIMLPELKDLIPIDVPWNLMPGVAEAGAMQDSCEDSDLSPSSEQVAGKAIAEAIRIFASRLHIRVGDIQIAKERMLSRLGTGISSQRKASLVSRDILPELENADDVTSRLRLCEDIYASMLAEYPTLMGVLVRILFYTNLGNANTSAQGDAVSSTSDVPPTAREGGSDGSGQQSAAERRTFLSAFEASFSKEVVSNAVSSVLLVLIQIGKQVHALCFEHICQLLHDNNCPILILKLLSTWFQPRVENSDIAPPANSGSEILLEPEGAPPATNAPPALPKWLQLRPYPPELRILPGALRSDGEESEMDPEPRNVATSSMLLDVLHRLTKRKAFRIAALVQWKASAVLKRILRVDMPPLRTRALKILKSQMPHLGRKWRNANMKVVTAIYLDMGFEFYEANPTDETPISVESATAEEDALRGLIDQYHRRHFGSTADEDTWDLHSGDDGGSVLDAAALPDSP